jgi:hypothetical protein
LLAAASCLRLFLDPSCFIQSLAGRLTNQASTALLPDSKWIIDKGNSQPPPPQASSMSKHQSKSTATPTCYNFSLQYKNKVELLHQKSEVYFFFTPSPIHLAAQEETHHRTRQTLNKQLVPPRDDVLVCLSSISSQTFTNTVRQHEYQIFISPKIINATE